MDERKQRERKHRVVALDSGNCQGIFESISVTSNEFSSKMAKMDYVLAAA